MDGNNIKIKKESNFGDPTAVESLDYRTWLCTVHLPWKKLSLVLTMEGITPVVPLACLDICCHSSELLFIVGPSVLIGGGFDAGVEVEDVDVDVDVDEDAVAPAV